MTLTVSFAATSASVVDAHVVAAGAQLAAAGRQVSTGGQVGVAVSGAGHDGGQVGAAAGAASGHGVPVVFSAFGTDSPSAGTSPAPTASASVSPGFGPAPSDDRPGSGDSVSAGLYGFLFVVVLAVVLAGLVWSMNRSLKRARRNLGGSELPRQSSDQVPVAPKPED